MATKRFDAVKLMRELRDKLNQEIEPMTPEARLRYIRDKAASTGLEKKVAGQEGDAAQRADAGGPAIGRPLIRSAVRQEIRLAV